MFLEFIFIAKSKLIFRLCHTNIEVNVLNNSVRVFRLKLVRWQVFFHIDIAVNAIGKPNTIEIRGILLEALDVKVRYVMVIDDRQYFFFLLFKFNVVFFVL